MNKGIYYENLPNKAEVSKEIPIDYGYHDKEIASVDVPAQEKPLDVSKLPIKVEIPNIGALPNDAYALLRRNGFGASDSSILLGVNPYKTLSQLILEKATPRLTAEEKAVGETVAVRKGNDLEPMIIHKYQMAFGTKTLKPIDMYQFKDYPFLKINYDGVTIIDGAYYPVEIKVCTKSGERHYNRRKAMYSTFGGFRPIPEDPLKHNWSIETKAAYYGVPPYYYTQVQQEMMGLAAPFGYLNVLFDNSWTMYTYFIWKDEAVQHQLILAGYNAWKKVMAKRAELGYTDLDFTPQTLESEEPGKPKTSAFDYIEEESQA